MQNFRNKAVSAKNFVARHRVSIAVVATAATCYAANRSAHAQFDEFLTEKGLYDEFYTPEPEVVSV